MQIDGTLDIRIIQGDSYRREITIDGLGQEVIEGIYFSSHELGVCKKCLYEDGVYVLYFSPSETENFKAFSGIYDLTVRFNQNDVNTICYNSSITILEKNNKVTCYGQD